MSAYVAQLRVYEPITAFPDDERERWESYVASQRVPSRVGGLEIEHRAALVAAIGGPAAQPQVDHAYVHRLQGRTYICPWRMKQRSWAALVEFRSSMPVEIADAFVPRGAAEAAARELTRWRSARPDLKSHIMSSTWHVPLRWFVPFEGEDRRLTLTGERSVSYLARMPDARRRVARALAVLRRTVDDDEVVTGVEDLGRWLEEYHPHSLLELDYGGLVALFDDVELEADESAADIAHSIACLSGGDVDEAVEAYRRVATRWGAARSVEAAN